MRLKTASVDPGDAIRKFIRNLLIHDAPRDVFLSFIGGGLPVKPEFFAFLDDPSHVDDAAEFAFLSNNIPPADGWWVFSERYVWEPYSYWLQMYVPAPLDLTPEEKERLREAEIYCLEHYENYALYAEAYADAQDEFEYWRTMPQDDRPPDYTVLLARKRRRMEAAEMEWSVKGSRRQFETNYAIVQDLSRRDPTLAKQSLQFLFGEPYDSDLGKFYWTGLLPRALVEPGATWNHYDVELASTPEQTISITSRRSLREPPQVVGHLPADGTKVSFDMARLLVDRQWYAPYMITSRTWKWHDSTRDHPLGSYPLSDGKTPPDGHLVMVPSEVILIRNKRITNAALAASLSSSMESAAALSIGPFGITQPRDDTRFSVAADVVHSHPRIDASASTVEANELEFFGFICHLLPMSPNPDWRLFPPIRQEVRREPYA